MILAAGAIFLSKNTKRVLLNFRSHSVSNSSTFSFFGGKIEERETVMEGLARELKEELGFIPTHEKIIPIDVYDSPDGNFRYHSFVIIVKKEFIPNINHESDGYIWCSLANLPNQLHNGARMILNNPSCVSNMLLMAQNK